MKKAVAYLFGNDIIGTVKFTDEDSCILIEADIKGVEESEYRISVDDTFGDYDLIILPKPCQKRIKIIFYIDCFSYFDLCGKRICIKNKENIALADGNIMRVIYGKRYYSQ